MNTLWRLRMHERHAHTSEEAQGHKALFRILKSVILESECGASKDLLRISEIQAVRGQVGLALRVVPGKLHLQTIYINHREL